MEETSIIYHYLWWKANSMPEAVHIVYLPQSKPSGNVYSFELLDALAQLPS